MSTTKKNNKPTAANTRATLKHSNPVPDDLLIDDLDQVGGELFTEENKGIRRLFGKTHFVPITQYKPNMYQELELKDYTDFAKMFFSLPMGMSTQIITDWNNTNITTQYQLFQRLQQLWYETETQKKANVKKIYLNALALGIKFIAKSDNTRESESANFEYLRNRLTGENQFIAEKYAELIDLLFQGIRDTNGRKRELLKAINPESKETTDNPKTNIFSRADEKVEFQNMNLINDLYQRMRKTKLNIYIFVFFFIGIKNEFNEDKVLQFFKTAADGNYKSLSKEDIKNQDMKKFFYPSEAYKVSDEPVKVPKVGVCNQTDINNNIELFNSATTLKDANTAYQYLLGCAKNISSDGETEGEKKLFTAFKNAGVRAINSAELGKNLNYRKFKGKPELLVLVINYLNRLGFLTLGENSLLSNPNINYNRDNLNGLTAENIKSEYAKYYNALTATVFNQLGDDKPEVAAFKEFKNQGLENLEFKTLEDRIKRNPSSPIYELLKQLQDKYKFLSIFQFDALCMTQTDKTNCDAYKRKTTFEHTALERINEDLIAKINAYETNIKQAKATAYLQFSEKSLKELVEIIYGYEAGQTLEIVCVEKNSITSPITGIPNDGNLKNGTYYPIYIENAYSELLTTNQEIFNLMNKKYYQPVLLYENTLNLRPVNMMGYFDSSNENNILSVNIVSFSNTTNTYGRDYVILLKATADMTIKTTKKSNQTKRPRASLPSGATHSQNEPIYEEMRRVSEIYEILDGVRQPEKRESTTSQESFHNFLEETTAKIPIYSQPNKIQTEKPAEITEAAHSAAPNSSNMRGERSETAYPEITQPSQNPEYQNIKGQEKDPIYENVNTLLEHQPQSEQSSNRNVIPSEQIPKLNAQTQQHKGGSLANNLYAKLFKSATKKHRRNRGKHMKSRTTKA